MKKLRKALSLATAHVLALTLIASFVSAAPPRAGVANARAAISRGLAYLRSTQEADGSWGHYPATTALALSAFLHNGKTELSEPATSRAVAYLLKQVKPSGAIYLAGNAAIELPNYNTCLCIMALSDTRNPNYKAIIRRAQKFLETSQFDDGENVSPSNPLYGGIGYGSDPDDHPDLGNLSTALSALHDTGIPSDAPVFKKALVFLQRVQNRTESNDQKWAVSGPHDGGFVYDPTGESKIPGSMAGGQQHSSMGAMTYAGLESYIYAGVTRNDPRAVAAYNWIRAHFSVKEHPGMGDTSLYYYYHTMSKTLDVYGVKVIKDKSGIPHDWAAELASEIVRRQHQDGSWYSSNSRYWENQPGLVTSYSLISLSYCLK